MRIAHVAIATPGKCGLYETTRELVAAERLLGADARIVDPKPVEQFYPGDEDRGVPVTREWDWALTADVIASHSGHDGTPVSETDQPILHVAHGRPLSTFLGERNGNPPGYSYQIQRGRDPRYRACVTFWPEHEPYLRTLWGETPVRVVPPPVDLDHWSPGSSDYDFAGRSGGVNVVMTDPWSRVDVSPFACIHAFALFRHICPNARLHLFAADDNPKGRDALLSVLGDALGVVQGWAADLRVVYRSAALLITPHRIWTRSIREAMACGCQVVSGRDCDPSDIEAFAMAMVARLENTLATDRMARALFDPAASAKAFLRVAEAL